MEMHEYVDTLVSQIRSKKAKEMLTAEIYAHIEDQASAYEEAGMERKSAYQEAVRQMGDPVEVGVALDRIHRPRMDFKAVFVILALNIIGISLSYWNLYMADWEFWGNSIAATVGEKCIFMFIGFACMIGICYLDYTTLLEHTLAFCLFLAFLHWVVVYGIFWKINHVCLFIDQYIYLFLPLYGAFLYRMRGYGYRFLLCCTGVGIGILGASVPSVYYCNDIYYTAYIRFCILALLMMILAVRRGWYVVNRKIVTICLWAAVAALTGIYIAITMYIGNIMAGNGFFQKMYNLIRQMKWFGNADIQTIWKDIWYVWWPDESVNLLYLFLSTGILAGGLVLAVYLFLLGYLLKSCLRQKNELGRIMGFGCVCFLWMETVEYVLENFGLLCSAGYSNMPFLQPVRDGSVVYYILTGICLSIYRYQDVLPANPVKSTTKPKYRLVFRIEKRGS